MSRSMIVIFVLLITACTQLDSARVDQDDEYTTAALSWLGADIQEMLAAWPRANVPCSKYSKHESGRIKCARWAHKERSGLVIKNYVRYNCETIARTRSDGIIVDVNVTYSFHCERRFKGKFAQMTRQSSDP